MKTGTAEHVQEEDCTQREMDREEAGNIFAN